MEPLKPLIEWPQPVFELLGFVAAFMAIGPLGFRFAVLGSRRVAADPDAGPVAARASGRAAAIGLIGIVLSSLLLAYDLPGSAAERHTTVAAMLRTSRLLDLQIALLALALLGFALALARSGAGWWLAALGVVAGVLRVAFTGRWDRLVNPVHMLAAGMWIGTLFVLVVAGLSSTLQPAVPPERRGSIAANMVASFSPLALSSAGVLVFFGVITAWLHLKYWAAIWTTPYGITFLVKLVAVLGVVALGAWNWRRQRPRMGSEAGAHALRRSARIELLVATVVLAITAILVSLPTPKLPGR